MKNMIIFSVLLLFSSINISGSVLLKSLENRMASYTKHPTLNLKHVEMYTKDTFITKSPNNIIIPKYFSELQYECVSTYPTRWIFESNTILDEDLKEIPRVVKRKMQTNESNSVQQYLFTSTVTLKYKKTDVLQNFTCRGIKNYGHLQSSIWATEISNNYVSIKLVSGKSNINDEGEYLGVQPAARKERFGGNPNCTLKILINVYTKTYSCQSNSVSAEVNTFLILCGNPDECNSFMTKDTCQNNSIEITEYPCTDRTKCVTFRPNAKPGAIICSDGISSVGLQYRVLRVPSPGNTSQYFEKLAYDIHEEINNYKGIEFISKDALFYDDMEHVFECRVSMYQYAHGVQWNLYSENGSFPNLALIDIIYGVKEDRNESKNIYTSTVKIIFNKHHGDYQVLFCVAPLWNEELQTNRRGMIITVLESSSPKNTKIIQISKRHFICETFAQPTANILWFAIFDKKTNEKTLLDNTSYNVTSFDNNKSELFAKYFPSSEITIVCETSNFKGSDTGTIVFDNTVNLFHVSSLLPVIFGVGGILLLSFFSVLVIYRIRQQKLLALSDTEVHDFINGVPSETDNFTFLPYDPNFEVPIEELKLDEKIGSGAYGTIRKGKYNSKIVAVKSIRAGADIIFFKALLSELKVMCHIANHVNLVNLIGACTKNIRQLELYIVVEYCVNGDLVAMLRNSRPHFIDLFDQERIFNGSKQSAKEISTSNLVRWSYEVATGMEYISSKNVIHGDLAARNILVTDNLTAKICDFGLAKQLYEDTLYIKTTKTPLPAKWMAIESLRDLHFSIETDIWSFGVTMWEIFSLGATPYPGLDWNFNSWKLLSSGHRMQKPDYANNEIYDIMHGCWDLNPKDRLPFSQLRLILREETNRFQETNNSFYSTL